MQSWLLFNKLMKQSILIRPVSQFQRKLSLIQLPGLRLKTGSKSEDKKKSRKGTESEVDNALTCSHIGDYTLGKTINSGRFGVLREIKQAPFPSNSKLAVKIVNRNKYPGVFTNEAKVYKHLMNNQRDDNLSEYLALPKHIFSEKDYLCIVLEYFEGKDLFDCLVSDGGLEEVKAKELFHQLVHGVLLLHSRKVIHRDIKPENVLLRLNEWGEVDVTRPFLTDFGLSYIMGEEDYITRPAGTFGYASPEILSTQKSDLSVSSLLWRKGHENGKGLDHLKAKADTWSLGVLLYATIAGELPFPATMDGATTMEEHLEAAHAGPKFDSTRWRTVSSPCKDIIQQMLHYSPEYRPSVRQLSKHHCKIFNLYYCVGISAS